MTVQELFKTIDTEDFIEEYLKNDRQTIDFLLDRKISMTEKMEGLEKIKEMLRTSFEHMKNLEDLVPDDSSTVFAVSYEEDGSFAWDVFSSEKEEILNAGKIERVERYACEFESIETMLCYRVSEVCRHMYNDLAVAVAIFDEMTFFGIDIDKRNKRVEETQKDIDDSAKECEACNYENCRPIGELFDELGWKDTRTAKEKSFDLRRMIATGKHCAKIYKMYMMQEKYYLTRKRR